MAILGLSLITENKLAEWILFFFQSLRYFFLEFQQLTKTGQSFLYQNDHSHFYGKNLHTWLHVYLLFYDSIDSDHQSGGGEGEGGDWDDEAGEGPGDAAEHYPEVPEGAGEHAEWDGGVVGQDQQDVRHVGQVQGRPHHHITPL